MGQPIWDRPLRDEDTVRLASEPRKPLSLIERNEGRILLGWLVFVILGSVIGAYFIALPHESNWMVEGWLRYTLWLMLGLSAVGVFLTLEPGSPEAAQQGNYLLGFLTAIFLTGFLISQPHTGAWFGQWMLTSLEVVFFGTIGLYILSQLAKDL